MLALLKTGLTNARSRFASLSALCNQVINSPNSNVAALHSRNLNFSSNSQAPKLKKTDCASCGLSILMLVRRFHILQQGFLGHTKVNLESPTMPASSLLSITPPGLQQLRTFKMKAKLRKRCKDCYLTSIKGQKMILCKTHPRHKQRQIMPHERSVWILTHATQGRIRPW